MGDGDLRMLGARDGLVSGLLAVRAEIRARMYYPIDRRYTRKIAAREAILRPLRDVEKRLVESFDAVKLAYEKSLQPHPTASDHG